MTGERRTLRSGPGVPIEAGVSDVTQLVHRCPSCGGKVAAVVVRRQPDTVTMQSCNRCDTRWWTADGSPVDPTIAFAKR